jgi:hypothetical protein
MAEERSSGRTFFERQQQRRKEMQARLAGRQVAQEPVVQEPGIGEPVAEEPVIEETVIEEVVAEEPVSPEPEDRAEPAARPEGALRLVVTSSGPNVGQTFGLHRRELTIGREEGSDIQLDDLTVSHNHALVRRHGDVVTIEDLRSKNGTTVNGTPVSHPVPMAPGDLITVGAVELVVEPYETGQR